MIDIKGIKTQSVTIEMSEEDLGRQLIRWAYILCMCRGNPDAHWLTDNEGNTYMESFFITDNPRVAKLVNAGNILMHGKLIIKDKVLVDTEFTG